MEVNLVSEGFKFMLVGMITVFAFLIFMVYILKVQGFFFKKYFSKKDQSCTANTTQVVQKSSGNEELVAVIAASIIQFRKKN